MKRLFLCLSILLWLGVGSLQAQEVFGKNFIGVKVLFLEYGRPNDADSMKLTNGLEAVYQYNLNKYISLAVPAKLGVINVIGDLDNRRFVGVDGLVHIHWYEPTARWYPYALVGAGVVVEEFEEYNTQIPIGAGLNIRVGQNSYINLQGEYRKSSLKNRNNLQAGLGVLFRLSKMEPDTDMDVVKDSADACPDEPGDPLLGGCPDRDGDGVVDREDKCPDILGVAALSGCPDRDGDGIADMDDQCPEAAGTAELFGCPDRDGDGIADRFDQCPDEPGLPANNGCPIPDSDGDGIPDEMDLCPTQAGTKATMGCPDRDNDGVADVNDRCPDVPGSVAGCPDTDGDGLVDIDDRCPNEAGPESNKGCPEIKEEVKEILEFAMRAVQFETGSAQLKSESFAVLDQIADIMRQYPAYKLRIVGHTDSVGDANNNKVLSEERAKACYQYLVSKGIVPSRLSYIGYGEERPIADNATSQGRALNRRTEFDLYLE